MEPGDGCETKYYLLEFIQEILDLRTIFIAAAPGRSLASTNQKEICHIYIRSACAYGEDKRQHRDFSPSGA